MCPGSPLMLKHAVSLLSGNSTTKWGSPSANGERGNGSFTLRRPLGRSLAVETRENQLSGAARR